MTEKEWGIDTSIEDAWWFNEKTGEVEHGPQLIEANRLGPFSTKADAERAHEIIAERARKWAEEEAAED